MANEKRKPGDRSTGRVTPKKDGAQPPAGRSRRFVGPERIGPFERPDPDRPLGQVGRRPSSPGFLMVTAVVWFGFGVASFFVLKGSVGVIVGIVLIGLSVLWVRGGLTAYLRQRGPGGD